jgi:two-component system cell cycle response regulator
LNVTISIGIAAALGESDNAEKLLHRADQALYRAKREGRNRVIKAAA